MKLRALRMPGLTGTGPYRRTSPSNGALARTDERFASLNTRSSLPAFASPPKASAVSRVKRRDIDRVILGMGTATIGS